MVIRSPAPFVRVIANVITGCLLLRWTGFRPVIVKVVGPAPLEFGARVGDALGRGDGVGAGCTFTAALAVWVMIGPGPVVAVAVIVLVRLAVTPLRLQL
jgi:hypothetical protein